MRYRCKTCGGTYNDTLPDGGAYYHVCPHNYDPVAETFTQRSGHRDERPAPFTEGESEAGPHRPARPARVEGRGRTKL
jgi:hypothetical protein